MTCICGYTRHEDWEIAYENDPELKAKLIAENGEEDFIRVNGNFTCTTERDYAPDYIREISVYACPKCGTLRVET